MEKDIMGEFGYSEKYFATEKRENYLKKQNDFTSYLPNYEAIQEENYINRSLRLLDALWLFYFRPQTTGGMRFRSNLWD